MLSSSSPYLSSSSRSVSSNCHSVPVPENSSEPSISVITCGSSNAANSSSPVQQYTTDRIKFLLKQQSSTYIVIKNEKRNSSIFGKYLAFQLKKSEKNDEYQKIEGFTSCQK